MSFEITYPNGLMRDCERQTCVIYLERMWNAKIIRTEQLRRIEARQGLNAYLALLFRSILPESVVVTHICKFMKWKIKISDYTQPPTGTCSMRRGWGGHVGFIKYNWTDKQVFDALPKKEQDRLLVAPPFWSCSDQSCGMCRRGNSAVTPPSRYPGIEKWR